jgi:peroxiredoxin
VREEPTEESSTPQKIPAKSKRTALKRIKRRRRGGSRISSNVMIGVFALIVVVVVGVILAAPGPSTGNGGEEYQIPFTVTTIHGEEIELSTYQGISLILYFSGVSCVPCQVHLPYLVAAYNYYNNTNKLEVVSLDIGGSTVGELLGWESANGISWKVCQDSGLTISSHYSVYSMPTLIVCDENGYELTSYVGTQDNDTIWAIFESAVS